MEAKVTIQVRVTPQMRDSLAAAADENGVSLSEFVRSALKDILEDRAGWRLSVEQRAMLHRWATRETLRNLEAKIGR